MGNPMAELLVDFITSLDGYASAVGWPGWTFDGRLRLVEYVPTVLTGPPSGGQLT